MTDDQQVPTVDVEALVKQAEERAEAVATQKISEVEERVAKQNERIADAISGRKEVDDPLMPAWKKRGDNKPADWDEEQAETKRIIKEELRMERDKEAKKAREQEEMTAKQKDEANKALYAEWDRQLDALEEKDSRFKRDEKIAAKVKSGEKMSKEDLEDPGVKARYELMKTAYDKGETNLKVAYYEHFNKDKKDDAGSDAPVFGRTRPKPQVDEDDFSYEEIQNATLKRDPSLLISN